VHLNGAPINNTGFKMAAHDVFFLLEILPRVPDVTLGHVTPEDLTVKTSFDLYK